MSVQRERPTQLVWTTSGCQSDESHMDIETSVYLRCHLSEDFKTAKSWNDLIDRLSQKGFHLKLHNKRLILVNEHTSVHLCTCSHLGFGFTAIADKLGKPHVHGQSNKLVRRP